MHSRISALKFFSLIFVLSFTTLAAGIAPAQPVQGQNEVHLDKFDLLTPTSGWILLDQHLFWTSDAGQTWDEIGTSIPAGAEVQDVNFINSNTGWLLWTSATPEDSVVFRLAQTIDHGTTWTSRALPLFNSGEIASYAEKAEMGWSDGQTGWISIKQNSGSNFSIGTLFRTSDGGNTWERFPLPVADKISFGDPQVGWAVGGPTGDQIFKTKDEGATWQDFRPGDLPANTPATAYMPFYSRGEGLLVMTSLGSENRLRVYSLEDPSNKWLLIDQARLDVQPGFIGLSILDGRNFVATIPGTTTIVRMLDGELNMINSQDDRSSSIVELDMVSPEVGWAKSVESNCGTASPPEEETGSVSCSSNTRLLQTRDGGLTWQSPRLPLIQSDVISLGFTSSNRSTAMSAAPGLGITEVFSGQGFDKCEIPAISQLQTWWNSSPYKTINLYVGGSSRACTNSALTSSYLSQLYQQGWKFIPTWVGPQAPCTGYAMRMSYDVTTAYNQGVNEANLAVERLAELGLTHPDKSGSVVYYDIEHYGTVSTCRDAVNAFMNGWVSQLRARGNLAGVYGSTQCNTGLSDFLNITNVPDVIWPARWYHALGSGYYDPNASVWNLGSCLPNTVWANHQRIRQYEGSHNETWGNLTLEIDSNVLDGVVAIPNVIPYVNSVKRADINPTNAAAVDFTVTFSETVTGVGANDFTLATTGLSNASITDVSGSGNTYRVRVNTGSGDGTLRLDLPVTATIADLVGNPLGALPFTSGETYTVDKGPVAADLVSPNGNIGSNSNPAYTWNKVTDATWYYLWVSRVNGDGSLTTIHTRWYTSSGACSAGTCSITPDAALSAGDYRWWVQTWNDSGYGPWSAGMNFSPTPPAAATLISPSNNIGANYIPDYTWNKVNGASWYYLWVDGPSGNVIKRWYTAAEAGCASTSPCSVPSPVSLVGGTHTWWIQTWSPVGYGAWSAARIFNTSIPPLPGAATLVSPNGGILDTTPDYTWNNLNNSTWYYLWISRVNSDGSLTTIHTRWYTSAEACGGTTCTITPVGVTLTSDNYRWWVQTWNESGYGPWSTGMDFTLPP
jgi:photosystem II stability/assembly factor-like uncharacterized protein